MQPVYKKIVLIACAFVLLPLITLAKDAPHYAIDNIPQELLRNANAVVRTNDVVFELISENKGKKETKYAVTILKEGAIDLSILKLNYDKLFNIDRIDGAIYDSKGKRVKKIKNEDIKDYSAISGSTLFTDGRVKHIDPEYYSYPFTIEYTYSESYNTLFFLPRWVGFEGYNVSIEHSEFTAIVPSTYKLRYLEKNIAPVQAAMQEDKMVYNWFVNNIEAINYEPLSPNYRKIYPTVFLAASDFELDGIKGNMESWNNLGAFMGRLLEGRDGLPEETIEEIKSLVNNAESKEDKIKKVYRYAQKKNRYISIQEGVGGWQPFPAETVDRLSYGDCKALSNYTMALLKAAGIESYYARIYAGNSLHSAPLDFSMNDFNHVILCVPCDKDTIWLECTSAQSPAGYMGDFTDDRYALIVKDNGGEFVKTPAYTVEENRQTTTGTVKIADNNSIHVEAELVYTGARYGDQSYLLHRDETDRRKKIINGISIPNFQLNNYQLEDKTSPQPSFTKKVQLEASNYCSSMGNRKLLKLNIFNAFNSVPRYARSRNNPVYVQRNYSECDTITFEVPTNLGVEALPKETVLNTKYGKYQSHAVLDQGQITYYRYFEINKGTYPKEEFNDFREFLEKVSMADNAKTVLISET
ncbi:MULTISPECIES: DUF3857 domain-containing protein [unclassified Carboxylicivirga]|uniref:DUF3857 domain-containing protein n=1 Tax=Carboxylicivirga TaxID=1628153 RepID=UPI003D32FA6A